MGLIENLKLKSEIKYYKKKLAEYGIDLEHNTKYLFTARVVNSGIGYALSDVRDVACFTGGVKAAYQTMECRERKGNE